MLEVRDDGEPLVHAAKWWRQRDPDSDKIDYRSQSNPRALMVDPGFRLGPTAR